MKIDELQMRKARLNSQLSDLDREKVEILTALTEIETEMEVLKGPDSEQQIWDKGKEINYDTHVFTLEKLSNELGEEYICRASIKWDSGKESKFIESIILGIPIPTILLANNKQKLLVIDGIERISVMYAFINNYLQLNNLTVLDSLNGLYFKDLLPSRQRKFLNTSIRTIIFSNTSEEVKKDLANRFNMNYKISDELDSSQLSLHEFLQTEDGQRSYKAGYQAMELSFNEGHYYPDSSYPSGSLEYDAFHEGVKDAFIILGGLGKTQK